MSQLRRHLTLFLRDEGGATAIEYALIASIVSIAAVTAMSQIGTRLETRFASVLPGFSR